MYSQRNTIKHEFIQTQDGSKGTKLSVQHGETIQQNDVVVRTRVNGLNEAVKKLETIQASGSKTRGRPARLGHEPVDEVPLRFYVQVSIQELDALVIPASFRDVLSLKTNMGAPPSKKKEANHHKVSLAIRCTKFCQYFVQLQWMSGQLVLLKGWKDLARQLHLNVGDILVFKYQDHAFKIKHFQFGSSTECVHFCDDH